MAGGRTDAEISERLALAEKIRRAIDEAGLHCHSMSDPTKEQKLVQQGHHACACAVLKVLRDEAPLADTNPKETP